MVKSLLYRIKNKKMLGCRLCVSAAGIAGIGTGIGVLRATGLGADPLNTLVSGVATHVGIPYAVLFLLVNCGLFAAALVFRRGHGLIGPFTVLTLLFTGLLGELMLGLLPAGLGDLPAGARTLIMAGGLSIQCLGVALSIVAGLGVSPYDAIAMIASRRTRFSMKTCRIAQDFTCAGAGFLLGGTAGAATGVALCCMGPAIQLFERGLRRTVSRVC
ncbi:MAG: hypothetical protein LBR00_06080 [Clostridiales Family XIII bacterium]|jgi:uncharacterized membrane protein YczE|nr:hypothetical protein [Clostridiales Family XIII bacterium]